MCGAQGISGTGSLRLGMEFLKRFHCSDVVYLSKPTWGMFLWQSVFFFFFAILRTRTTPKAPSLTQD